VYTQRDGDQTLSAECSPGVVTDPARVEGLHSPEKLCAVKDEVDHASRFSRG
jgi:hypothetical protein